MMSFGLGGSGPVCQAEPEQLVRVAARDLQLAQLPHGRMEAALAPEALYHRVWALIKEQYYEQSFNGQSWERWAHRYDGKLKTGADAHKAIETMLASLGDRYTRFLDKEAFTEEEDLIHAKLYGVGIQIGMDKSQKVIVIAPIDNTPAAKAGLMPRDEILEIDGKSTKGLMVDEAAKQIKGPLGTQVTLTVLRNGKPLKFTMVRDEIHISAIPTAAPLPMDKDIGYIRLSSFISKDANDEMQTALEKLHNTRGIILDLRDNPGGLLSNAINISNMFLEGGMDIVSTVDKDGYKTPSRSDGKPRSVSPLVILINHGSASASEIYSGAMKDNHRAILVGETSFGKGLVQGITKLPDGSGVNITIQRYLTPNDTDIHKKGISPDYTVTLTHSDYETGRGPWWIDKEGGSNSAKVPPADTHDAQLLKAVDVLHAKMATQVVVGQAKEPAGQTAHQ